MKINNNRIILVTGGARSGKSSFALETASKDSSAKAYIATAEALDEEMRERIQAHRKQRGNEWHTFEEPLKIGELLENIKGRYEVVIIDCLTMWLSNLMTGAQSGKPGTEAVETEIRILLDSLGHFKESFSSCSTAGLSSLFIVSNEVGMGIVPDNELSRRFRDLAGSLNRRLAETADEVYFMVSGIPLKVKG